jgi:hypothetical protein
MVLTVFCLFKMVFITNIQTKMDSYFTAISSLLIICIIKSLEVKYLCIGLSLVILCLEVLQSYKKVDQVYQKFIFFLLVVSGIIGPAILMLKTTQNEQLITNGILISSSLIMFYLAKLNIIKLDGKKVYYKLQQ